MAKLQGRFADGSDSKIPPLAVTGVTATDIGTNRPYLATANTTSAASAANTGGAVTVAWTVPSNSVEATQYLITSTPATYTATVAAPATSYVFQGLASNTAYTFTITPQNNFGSGLTTTSSSVTSTTVPDAPPQPTVSNAVNSINVSYSAPTYNGGKAITSYTVKDNLGTVVTSVTANPYGFAETAGSSESFQVAAVNSNGQGAYSVSSASGTSQPPSFFAPPGFFAPPRFCIDQDTPIACVTEDGGLIWKKASDVNIEDKIWSATWDGLDSEFISDPFSWSSDSIDNIKLVISEISNIIASTKDVTLIVNKDNEKRFSLEQTILIKRNDKFFFATTGVLEIGDIIVERLDDSGQFEQIFVSDLEIIDEQRTVYEFDAAPNDILIAGGLIVHNKKIF